jgi:hypothetical protein
LAAVSASATITGSAANAWLFVDKYVAAFNSAAHSHSFPFYRIVVESGNSLSITVSNIGSVSADTTAIVNGELKLLGQVRSRRKPSQPQTLQYMALISFVAW